MTKSKSETEEIKFKEESVEYLKFFPHDELLKLWSEIEVEAGVLYVVGTPIGNIGDISIRALRVLQKVDIVLAEDTRTSGLLLNHFGIKPSYLSFHQHNFASRTEQAIELLKSGKSLAQISDAGMPAISDPGSELVDRCLDEGIVVKVIPGPSASTAILSLSGFDTSDFRFIGFLPQKANLKEDILEDLKTYSGISIFYEAPHRLLKTLEDLFDAGFGSRRIALGRELTKHYEEVIRDNLENLLQYFKENSPRGEFVFVLDKPSIDEIKREAEVEKLNLEATIKTAFEVGKTSKTIQLELQDQSGISKNELKKLIQKLKPE